MYTFLVLGLIPGTNVQISFQAWLAVMAMLPFLAYLAKEPLRKILELGMAATPRLPLHASQLHHRLQ